MGEIDMAPESRNYYRMWSPLAVYCESSRQNCAQCPIASMALDSFTQEDCSMPMAINMLKESGIKFPEGKALQNKIDKI